MSSIRDDDIDSRKRVFDRRHPGRSEDLWTRRSEPPFDQRTSSGRNDGSQNPSLYRIPKKRDHSGIDNSRRDADEDRPSRFSSQNTERCFKRPDHRQHDREGHREPTTSSNRVIHREWKPYDPRASSVPLSSSRRSAPAYSRQSSSSGGQNHPERSFHNSQNESERSSEANVNNEPKSLPVQPGGASSAGASLAPDAMNQTGSSFQGSKSTSQKVWTKEKEAALISFVEERRFLYDPNDPFYQDKNKMYNLWRTLRRVPEFNTESTKQVRAMWESLCRRYYGELARLADGHDPKLPEDFMQSMNFLPDIKELGPTSIRDNRPQANGRTRTGQFLKLIDEKFQPYSSAERARLEVNLLKVFADFGEPASEQRR